jgi:tetratricopeptide (TPR) repeat protein
MMMQVKRLDQRPSDGAPGSAASSPDRLDSWKEIATYLRREVRTVQLWEKNEGLPVHRHFHKQLGSVYAFRSEIDNWRQGASRPETPRVLSKTVEDLGDSCAPVRPERVLLGILPFENQGADPDEVRFADEIFGKIIAAIELYKPGAAAFVKDGSRVSSALRSVGRFGNGTLELEVTVAAAESAVATWSHTSYWDARRSPEILTLAVDQIVKCLWLKLVSTVTSPGPLVRSEKPSSREAYLRGRYFWNQRNEAGMRKAIRCFSSAIQDDPGFALAYTGLADSLNLLSFYEIEPPSEAMPAARRAALKAIELEPNLAEAHASLADICLHFDRDWAKADEEYRRAIECNPRYALSYHWYANLLAAKGQHEAAHMAIMQALEIDPISPISVVWAGVTSHLARRYPEAVDHYKDALELNPEFIWAHMYLAQSLEQQGDFDEAIHEFETAILLTGGSNCMKAMKAHTLAIAGDGAAALRLLRELSSQPGQQSLPSYDMAAAYAALGDPETSVSWLRRACRDRNMKLFTLTQDPRFDPLRSYAAFRKIVGDVGLDRYISN